MSISTIILLIVFAFGAAFTQRVTGFGFGIFIMTLLPHIMPSFGEATALSGAMALISVTVTSIRLFRHIEWRKLIPILVTFLIVSFVCVRLIARIDGHSLKKILGVVLILISFYFFKFGGKIRIKPSVGNQVGLGTISGVMGGFFAMQGPPAVIFFLSCTDTKEKYMALISAYFFAGNIFMSVFRYSAGFFTPAVGWSWLIAFPAVVAGILVGAKVYIKMPINIIRKVVYAYMAVAGLISLIL